MSQNSFLTNNVSATNENIIVHTYFKIKSGNSIFLADVFKDELNERDVIRFGGKKKDCIIYSVYWDEDEHRLPNLEGISYDEKCTLDTHFHLERKRGTIKMLKVSLQFLCYLYNSTSGVLFKDTSFMKCLDNIRVELSVFYIAKYGKTWYQDKFNACPYEVADYEKNLDNINSTMDAPLVESFSEFHDKYIKGKKRGFRKWFPAVKKIYEESHSYREFVKKLHNMTDCSIFDTWLSYFMKDIGVDKLDLGHIHFIITRVSIDQWNNDIEIESNVSLETI